MGSSHLTKHSSKSLPQFWGWMGFVWLAILKKGVHANDANARQHEKPATVNSLDFSQSGDGRKLLIKSGEDTIEALLFLPDDAPRTTPPPVYVLAGGMGSVKETSTMYMARQIQRGGAAAIVFDYRYWGASGGQPRHVVVPVRQVQDLKAVVNHVIDTGGFGGLVDPLRIHLVGASLGAGHVLTLAAQFCRDNDEKLGRSVRTVTAVAPYLHPEGVSTSFFVGPATRALHLVALATADLVAAAFGSSPIYVDLFGPSDGPELSVLQVKGDELKLWQKLRGNRPPTQVAARSICHLNEYRPLDTVSYIRVPTLFVSGEQDTIASADLTKEAATRINRACAGRPQLAERVNVSTSHLGFLTYPVLDEVVDKIRAFTEKWDGHRPELQA